MRARVLGALAFEAVGEQQREAALAPLVVGRDDELVDDDLRAVGEVAELGLPADTSASGATEYPYSKPSAAYSDSTVS